MRYGINTLLWTAAFDESHIDLLPRFKSQGFDGAEIARFDFAGFPAAPLRRALEANDLACTFCSALTGGLSLVSDEPGTRHAALDFLATGIKTAAELGAELFAGPFCAPVGHLPGRRRTEEEWNRAVEGLQALTPILDEHRVTMAIEPLNRFETYFLNTSEDGLRLSEQVGHPRVGILLDTFHANIEEKKTGAAFASLGFHLKHVHACENDRGTPGSGHVNWQEFFAALESIRYDDWIVIESFGSRIPEIAAATCMWRDVAGSPEEIARDGVAFLKRR